MNPVTDPSCMDDSDPHSLPVDAARLRIRDAIEPVRERETVPIRLALNRILAEDLHATMNVPGAANSAMDGYAVDSAVIPETGTVELKITGTSWAGRPYGGVVPPGGCVRIMTGAVLPAGTDTVVMQENTRIGGDRVTIDSRTLPGENVRAAGEDFSRGDLVIRSGTSLYPPELGLIASLGIGEIKVWRKLRVACFMTGDELRAIGEPLDTGQIYDSNRYTLYGMLARLGAEMIDLGIVRDDRDAIEKALLQAADAADAIVTSGGVSVGDADLVREVLGKVGQVNFWKVAMKPGRPLAFGRVRNAWFFGLPGNPVSTVVTFYQFVLPALKKLMGEEYADPPSFRVTCSSNLKKRPGRQEYQRGILYRDAAGELAVKKTGAQGSGILSSMTRANCFIILPVENDGVVAGESVEVQPFFGLM